MPCGIRRVFLLANGLQIADQLQQHFCGNRLTLRIAGRNITFDLNLVSPNESLLKPLNQFAVAAEDPL